MDFAFDPEQDELRQTVRQALAREFPVAALREFYEATPDRKAATARARCRPSTHHRRSVDGRDMPGHNGSVAPATASAQPWRLVQRS